MFSMGGFEPPIHLDDRLKAGHGENVYFRSNTPP